VKSLGLDNGKMVRLLPHQSVSAKKRKTSGLRHKSPDDLSYNSPDAALKAAALRLNLRSEYREAINPLL
jgi:hypothetical protein